jgi:integrase
MDTIKNFKERIDALSKDKEAMIWDSTIRGFGFLRRRAKNGTMFDRYIARKRLGKLMPKMTLDAAVVSFTKAQDAAKDWLAEIQLKNNPRAAQQAKLAEQSRIMYAEGAADYLKVKAGTLAPNSLKQATLYLTNPAYFGFKKALADVTGDDVTARLDVIRDEHGAATANRSRSILHGMFEWAVKRSHCKDNPVKKTDKPAVDSKRERVLTNDELKAIWNACDPSDDYGRIVRLLILTGCRREEIGGLRWSEVNLDEGTITIAADRCKNGRAHTLTLPALALNILRAIPQRVGSDFLFGSNGNGFTMWSHSKAHLKDGCAAWRLHDARRTVATGMGDIGVLPHVIEAVLNHISGHKAGVAGIYNRSTYARDIRNALAMWSDHVNSIVTGEAPKVVALPLAAA